MRPQASERPLVAQAATSFRPVEVREVRRAAHRHDLLEQRNEGTQGAKADRGEGTPGELSSAEREELKRLRRENREQQQTIEILKKATAFFVKENDR